MPKTMEGISHSIHPTMIQSNDTRAAKYQHKTDLKVSRTEQGVQTHTVNLFSTRAETQWKRTSISINIRKARFPLFSVFSLFLNTSAAFFTSVCSLELACQFLPTKTAMVYDAKHVNYMGQFGKN